MDTWHDDVKTDDMGQEFLRWFKMLIPKDRDLFFQILEEERQKIKEQEHIQEDTIDSNTKEQELEKSQQEPLIEKDIESKDISQQILEAKEQFVLDNATSLQELELMQNSENCTIYHDKMIFPQDKLEAFQKDLENNPKAKLTDHINMDSIKENLANEQSFQKLFKEEIASLQEPSMENSKKLDPNNYFNDLIDWFDKKKLDNENMPLTKNEFKAEFLEYCKNGMNENEMKILLLLANKEPSRLTKEHKDMLNEGLKYNLTNNKLLDKGLECAIRAEIGEGLINNNVIDFAKSAEKLKTSNNIIDKKMCETTLPKIANKIKDQSSNLNSENTAKLNAIINNQALPQHTKTKGRSK
ncbi:hypothetical protein [Helicobacter japonicus]|uniref:hypothetical protein n=1 Tax=Helicobacter japonicus TaxID=425400 RepID=UPI0023C11B67|nr:hypothetical protein [Helicobacter japonicus]MDE7235234.1 hypothetical protein [Helicobacter japonicus]